MKRLVVVALLAGCASQANTAEPPSAEAFLDLLIASGTRELSQEPGCDIQASARSLSNPTVGTHLAALLAGGGSDNSRLILSGSCEPAGSDPGWSCSITITEETESGEYIAGSTLMSRVSGDGTSLIPGTLRCL